MKRVILIVLDSVGAGALPDADAYGDAGANTLRHIEESHPMTLPHLRRMGLGRIPGVGIPDDPLAVGAYGRAAEQSRGKDTTTGHWEIAGLRLDKPFPLYPDGFPADVISAFEREAGVRVIGNKPASGTEILDELGEEHMRTGKPIVYTSGDSVFQIAAHKDVIPLDRLYELCGIARKLLVGGHAVGRVIARPFIGAGRGRFTRTGERRDYSLPPVGETLLDAAKARGLDVIGVGKIEDIFAHRGLTGSVHSSGNPACVQTTLRELEKPFHGLLFVNLVDFDSVYGHRRDAAGYAAALEAFDSALPDIQSRMTDDDLLILTADHGCDPTHCGTDHTREYIPILAWHKKMTTCVDLGTRATFSDIAATAAQALDMPERFGAESFYDRLEETAWTK